MGEAQGKQNREIDFALMALSLLSHVSLGEAKSVRQNRCQSGIPLHNGASREGLETSSNFSAGTYQNCLTIQSHQERANSRDSHVPSELRNV